MRTDFMLAFLGEFKSLKVLIRSKNHYSRDYLTQYKYFQCAYQLTDLFYLDVNSRLKRNGPFVSAIVK